MDRRAHWEGVYQTRPATETSWFEPLPAVSLSLIRGVAPAGGRIIDVGGGTSSLVDQLVEEGMWEVTVLDVSGTALEQAQARLQEKAARVRWIQADITEAVRLGTYDIWHDRAVFHFLTTPADRAAYLDRLRAALRPGGHAVLGTFALAGPETCSALPVCRYGAASLAATLGADFTLVRQVEHAHRTPQGTIQPFVFGVFRKAEKATTQAHVANS
ncbi:MAG: class I SAM-dependent methyltransferase [Pirellulales bacterium]|nr:class I SAM-dependent methyltransferase [Pirellulales bacterium]